MLFGKNVWKYSVPLKIHFGYVLFGFFSLKVSIYSSMSASTSDWIKKAKKSSDVSEFAEVASYKKI